MTTEREKLVEEIQEAGERLEVLEGRLVELDTGRGPTGGAVDDAIRRMRERAAAPNALTAAPRKNPLTGKEY